MQPVLAYMHNHEVHKHNRELIADHIADVLQNFPIALCNIIFEYYIGEEHKMLVSSIAPHYPQVDPSLFLFIENLKDQIKKEDGEGNNKLITVFTQGVQILTDFYKPKMGAKKLKFELRLFVGYYMQCGIGAVVMGDRESLVSTLIDDRPEEAALMLYRQDIFVYSKPEFIVEIMEKAVKFGKVHLLEYILVRVKNITIRCLTPLLGQAVTYLGKQKLYQSDSNVPETLANWNTWRTADYEEIARLLFVHGADPFAETNNGYNSVEIAKHFDHDLFSRSKKRVHPSNTLDKWVVVKKLKNGE